MPPRIKAKFKLIHYRRAGILFALFVGVLRLCFADETADLRESADLVAYGRLSFCAEGQSGTAHRLVIWTRRNVHDLRLNRESSDSAWK